MAKAPASSAPAPKRSTYQHGNLPAALKDAVLELVAERGIKGVAVIEAARRSGVSSGAPYRHFANKESLLAAVGAIVYRELVSAMAVARRAAGNDGSAQLSSVVKAYVLYAARNRSGLEVLFRAGLNHDEHAELARLDTLAYGEYRLCANALGLDGEEADHLVYAAAALAHGFTMLQLVASGPYAMTEQNVMEQVEKAARNLAQGFLLDTGSEKNEASRPSRSRVRKPEA